MQPRFDDAVRLRALVGAANAGMMNALQESGHSFARSYVFLLSVCFSKRLKFVLFLSQVTW